MKTLMYQNLYRILVEVGPMSGTDLPEDCGGAWVDVYLAADTIKSAIDAAEHALLEDRYRPVATLEAFTLDLEHYTDYDEAEEADHIPTADELLQLWETGGVWYSAFFTFPPEEARGRTH